MSHSHQSPPSAPQGGPPAGPPGQPDPGSGRRQFVLGSILIPAVLAVFAVVAAFLIAPWQEQRAQQGVEGGEKAELAKEAPLRTRVGEAWNDADDLYWVLDQPLTTAQEARWVTLPQTADSDVVDFARQVRAVRFRPVCGQTDCEGSETALRLTLTGHRASPVEVTGITARILSQDEPPSGGFMRGPMGGSALVESGLIDLDSPDRQLRTIEDDGTAGARYFDERSVTLQKDEVLAFRIVTTSSSYDYRFELVLNLMVDGKPDSLTVRSDGTTTGPPFRNPGHPRSQRTYDGYYECEVGEKCRIGPGPYGYSDEG